MGTRYRDDLIRMIREAGQELIDKGETTIPEGAEGITNTVITIRIPTDTETIAIPTIETSVAVEVVCKSSMKKYKA